MTAMWLGTPLYVAPEQAQGHPATKQSDIYSLGVILYEMGTGVYPFFSESGTAVLMLHVNSAPTPPALFHPAIPPPVTTSLPHAMAQNPAAHFRAHSTVPEPTA